MVRIFIRTAAGLTFIVSIMTALAVPSFAAEWNPEKTLTVPLTIQLGQTDSEIKHDLLYRPNPKVKNNLNCLPIKSPTFPFHSPII